MKKTPNWYPWHRKKGTSMAFREWVRRPTGPPTQGPISLMQIDAAIQNEFLFDDPGDWQEAMRLCIAELLRRGYRPALYNYEVERLDRGTLEVRRLRCGNGALYPFRVYSSSLHRSSGSTLFGAPTELMSFCAVVAQSG